MAMTIEGIVSYFNGLPAILKAQRASEDAEIADARAKEDAARKAARDAEDTNALELLQGAQSIQQQLAAAAAAAAALPQTAAA